MKPRNCPGAFKSHSTIWYGCAVAVCAFTFQSAAMAGSTPAPAAAPEEAAPSSNWITFTMGGAIVSGDDVGMMRRTQINDDIYGGIESFGYSRALNDDYTMTLGGHALPGLEDYGFEINVTNDDLGYVKASYNEYRTWYDGSGGSIPGLPATWVPLHEDEHSVDRGELSFEAGLRKEGLPEITFGYTHGWRNGSKDSTSWGGIPSGSGSFKTIPALTEIDEVTDTFTLDFTHTLGKTDFGGGLTYVKVNNEDTRVMTNGAPLATVPSGNTVRDTAAYDSDLFNGHLFSETRINDQLMFSFGYSYTNLDTDIGGDRPSNSNLTGALLTSADHALFAIQGGAQTSINVLNANVCWNPIADLTIVPSLRAEYENQNSWSNHIAGVRGGANATSGQLEDAIENGILPANGSLTSDTDWNSYDLEAYTEALEIRYRGIDNIVLYGSAEFAQILGDTDRSFHVEEYADSEEGSRSIDSDVDKQKFVLGANWYPLSCLSVTTQGYYQSYHQSFDNILVDDDAQISQHNNDTTDFNIRLNWRALSNLTFVTRYDYQQSKIENESYYSGTLTTDLIESADITRHILTESVMWNPLDRLYLQGSIHWVSAETDTPMDSGPNNVPVGIVPDSDNDYWSASFNAGYAIDAKTDITASYAFYAASNYSRYPGPGNAIGYGLETEEHAFSLTLTRILTPNMIWNLRYGVVTSQTEGDDQTGGYNDFTAQMVSTGLQIRF